VLSKAIEELNADLAYAKSHRPTPTPSSAGQSSISMLNNFGSAGMGGNLATGNASAYLSAVEYEHLKKMKALCHRRIG
jgi:hypothetical protein